MTNRTDIKIFILFLLNEINCPLDMATIQEVMAECRYVGSFDFTECFSTLKEKGHIRESREDGKVTYMITDMGRMVAAELSGDLLESIREKSRKCAARIVSFHQRGITITVDIIKKEEGQYMVACRFSDKGGMLLSMDLRASTYAEAEKIRAHFREKPEQVFRGVLAVATGEVDYYL